MKEPSVAKLPKGIRVNLVPQADCIDILISPYPECLLQRMRTLRVAPVGQDNHKPLLYFIYSIDILPPRTSFNNTTVQIGGRKAQTDPLYRPGQDPYIIGKIL